MILLIQSLICAVVSVHLSKGIQSDVGLLLGICSDPGTTEPFPPLLLTALAFALSFVLYHVGNHAMLLSIKTHIK